MQIYMISNCFLPQLLSAVWGSELRVRRKAESGREAAGREDLAAGW